MALLEVIATIFGILMSIANIPQAYRIFKRKSAKDISPITYFTLAIGSLVWFIYGINQKSYPIMLSYGPGTIFTSLVFIGWIMYRNGEGKPVKKK